MQFLNLLHLAYKLFFMFKQNQWDARYFQIIFQLSFLSYGVFYLGWNANWAMYSIYIATALGTQWLGDSMVHRKIQPIIGKESFLLKGGLSALISAASLCLLLKTNHLYMAAIASFISIASKFLLKANGKHIFNPSALGIVVLIYCTNDAWLLPAQWGFNATIFFMVATLGTIVITKVQKLDVCFAFLFTFLGLTFYRQVIYLNWPIDFFWQSMSTGSLLLFTFFMISDPKTAPNNHIARIVWGSAIGGLSFYVTAYHFVNAAPIKVLVILAPLVPIFDYFFKATPFTWQSKFIPILKIPRIYIPQLGKKIGTFFLVLILCNNDVMSFCGCFVERIDTRYVSNADGTLKNKTSQVIMVRDGNKNVITMYNDFKGDSKDFAMVVPVPTVLKKNDIKVVDQNIFNTLNEYSKPKLLQFYDRNPCTNFSEEDRVTVTSSENLRKNTDNISQPSIVPHVKIEAQYLVGEYDITILSATESGDLKTWLSTNGYKLPDGAEEVLEPYIKSKLKFFVAKVNLKEKEKMNTGFLRPIQITFTAPKFMLPIRLGMANADGDQDMIVYAFTKKGRVECTNYRTVNMPTDKQVPLFVQQNFGAFYSNLYEKQWKDEGKSIAMLEYAWNVSPFVGGAKCDPCVSAVPNYNDLVQAGVWWLNGQNWNDYSDVDEDEEYNIDNVRDVYFTRLHIRYNRESFAQDINFMLTPNKENFQTTYKITHPAPGDFSCEAGKQYLKDLKKRRKKELKNLYDLTGKTYTDWSLSYNELEENNEIKNSAASYAKVSLDIHHQSSTPNTAWAFTAGLLGLGAVVYLKQKTLFNV
jgi:Na+-translocating ferredoxin:NAD+ oxidoreductase RnfD subunit